MRSTKKTTENCYHVAGIIISRRWPIFLVTAALFILSQFYRATIAVITPQLITDLSMSTRELSLMSAAFFYAFATTPLVLMVQAIGRRYAFGCVAGINLISTFVFYLTVRHAPDKLTRRWQTRRLRQTCKPRSLASGSCSRKRTTGLSLSVHFVDTVFMLRSKPCTQAPF